MEKYCQSYPGIKVYIYKNIYIFIYIYLNIYLFKYLHLIHVLDITNNFGFRKHSMC